MTDAIYPLATAPWSAPNGLEYVCQWMPPKVHARVHPAHPHTATPVTAPRSDDGLACVYGGDTSHGYAAVGNYTPAYGGWSAGNGGAGFFAGEMPWVSGGPGLGVLPGVIEVDVGTPLAPIYPAAPEVPTWGMVVLGAAAFIAAKYTRGKA